MSSSQECVECRQDDADGSQQPPEKVKAEQPPQEAANGAVEDPLNPATFIPPAPLPTPNIVVEFCDRVCSLLSCS